jgi:hypothetical protein
LKTVFQQLMLQAWEVVSVELTFACYASVGASAYGQKRLRKPVQFHASKGCSRSPADNAGFS